MTRIARKLLGVVGHPVAHSASPELFAKRFAELGRDDLEYRKFDLPRVEDFPALLDTHPELVGLNVTVPHKKTVIPHLTSLSVEARALGAVNTLVRKSDGWHGHNTDVWGFQRALGPFLTNRHERALVLGTGGSAAAVHHVLSGLGIETTVVSRTGNASEGTTTWGRPCLGYHEVSEWTLKHHLLVVHCTPVGMSPLVDDMPDLPVQFLTPNHLVVDLIYNPAETRLLREARLHGAAVLNGADMLRLQAEKAWEIWVEAGV
jgi:shikimate dehydrogenase